MFCIKRDFVSPAFDDLLLQILRSKLNTKVIVSEKLGKKWLHIVSNQILISVLSARPRRQISTREDDRLV